MDHVLNPKDDKQSIYEIYRACRLCGGGAGYKMPIIQNVVDLNGDGVELRHKIIECVNIEVNNTDRMPPLICELCVDKVNDFYKFLELCRQTNKKTRLRLGLPLKSKPQGSPDSDNCILGVTEPVFQDNSDSEPPGKKSKKTKIREPPETKGVKMKIAKPRPSPKPRESGELRESRESSVSSEEYRFRGPRSKNRAPSPIPKRTTRQQAEIAPEILFEESPQSSSWKRLRERSSYVDTPPPPDKKMKLAPEPVKTSKPGPKSSKVQREAPTPAPPPIPPPPPTKTNRPLSKKERKRSPTPPKPSPSKTTPSKTTLSKNTSSKTSSAIATSSKTTSANATSSKTTSITATSSKTTSASTTSSKTSAPAKPSKEPSDATPRSVKAYSKTTSRSTPAKTTPRAEVNPEPKIHVCQICNVQTKNQQGLMSHIRIHSPAIIDPKYACNACELWFESAEAAAAHHRDHRDDSAPYKCTRCYGYFKLRRAYDDHFGQNLCLSVYEVPDVECPECWRSFPTNKLLEDHKCAGEDGRPGGKCSKCGRNYTLLKNLTKHESTCNYRKKGEVVIDPAVQARLLPMQVRVARCDSLLAGTLRVHASTVSHKYGLDSKCKYPYLNASSSSSKFKHMVSINEDIKAEFCAEQWDAHGDSDSDISQRTVGSLSSMSLKILSNESPDKVPEKVKTEEAFDLEMGKKIDSIIDTLCNDDALTTCSVDSDSILDKNNAKDDSGALKGDKDVLDEALKDDSRASFNSDSILDNNDNSEVTSSMKETEKETSSLGENISTDAVKEQNYAPENAVSINVPKDFTGVDDEKTTNKDSNDSESIVKSNDNNREVTQKASNDSETNIEDFESSSKTENDLSNENDKSDDINKQSVQSNMETDSEDNVKIQGDASDDSKTSNLEIKNDNDECSEKNENLKSNTASDINEKIDVHKESENTIDITGKLDTNNDVGMRDEFDKRSPNNEDLSKIDEITNKILQETESHEKVTDEKSQNIDAVSVNGANQIDFNDDQEHRADFDAQIANNEQKVEKKPFSINDLLRKPDDLKSLDLDSISDDEFNFDV